MKISRPLVFLAVALTYGFATPSWAGRFPGGKATGSFFTGQPVLKAGLRQVIFGLLAALVTFGLGKQVGAGLGL